MANKKAAGKLQFLYTCYEGCSNNVMKSDVTHLEKQSESTVADLVFDEVKAQKYFPKLS